MWVDHRITLKQYINSRNYRKYAENMTRCKKIRSFKGLDSSDVDLYTNKKQKQMEKQLSDRLFQVKVFVRQYIIEDDKFIYFQKMIENFLQTLHIKLQERKKDQIVLHNVLEKQMERSQILQQQLQKSQIGANLMSQRSFRDFDDIQKKSKSNSQSQDELFLSGLNKALGRVQNPEDRFQVVSSATNQAQQNFQQAPNYEIKLNVISPSQKRPKIPKQLSQISKRKSSADSQLLHIPDMKKLKQKEPLSPISSATSRDQKSSARERNVTVSYRQPSQVPTKQIQRQGIFAKSVKPSMYESMATPTVSSKFSKNQTTQARPGMHESMAPSQSSKFSKKHAEQDNAFINRRIKRKQTLAKKRNEWNLQNDDADEQWKTRNKQFDDPMAVMRFFGI